MASVLLPLVVSFIILSGSVTESECKELGETSDGIRVALTMASKLFNPKKNDILASVLLRLTQVPRNHNKRARNGDKEELLPALLKVLMGGSDKLQEYAFNGFITVAHLLSQVLTEDKRVRRHQRTLKEFSPFHFVIRQPKVVSLLTQMRDPNIIDLILKEAEDRVQETPEGENVDCIQLLICKTTPFVRGMQKSLTFFMKREDIGDTTKGTCPKKVNQTCDENEEEFLWEKGNFEDRMFFFFPTLKEVIDFGDNCDRRYPNCIY